MRGRGRGAGLLGPLSPAPALSPSAAGLGAEGALPAGRRGLASPAGAPVRGLDPQPRRGAAAAGVSQLAQPGRGERGRGDLRGNPRSGRPGAQLGSAWSGQRLPGEPLVRGAAPAAGSAPRPARAARPCGQVHLAGRAGSRCATIAVHAMEGLGVSRDRASGKLFLS